jgi:hypothetical protein
MTAMRATKVLSAMLLASALLVAAAHGKTPPPAFNHAVHAANQVACADCHKDILTVRGVRRVLPVRATCATCHPESRWPASLPATTRDVTFVHSGHKDAAAECAACHKDPDVRTGKDAGHKACAECHAQAFDELQCGLCHGASPFAGQNALTDFRHKDRFLAEHGVYATRSFQSCRQCHTESYCNDCHGKRAEPSPSIKYPEAVTRNLIHRGDYVTLHPIEARTDDSKCLTCHARRDCNDCHARRGVGPSADRSGFRHPDGFLASHGKEARQDIVRCASCHEQTGYGNCVACHKASSGVNPHPKGWEDRRTGLSQSSRMCATCHNQ